MAKKTSIDNRPPAAQRYSNDQLEGMGSTAKCPNQMRTGGFEKVPTTSIPEPCKEGNEGYAHFMHRFGKKES